MPDRNRVPYRAAGRRRVINCAVLLALFGTGLAAQPNAGNGNLNGSAQQRQNQVTQPPAPLISPAIQADVERIAKALEAANSKQETATEKQRAEENLDAQKQVAKWAFIMLFIAGAEMLLTVAGVILVGYTLAATRRAAKAAEDTLKSMIRLERPHMIAGFFRHSGLPDAKQAAAMGAGDIVPSIFGTVNNFGDRLGIVHGFSTGDLFEKEGLPVPRLNPGKEITWFMHEVIAPKGEHTWHDPFAIYATVLPAKIVRAIVCDGHPWFLYGYVRYSDSKGIFRRSGFAFAYRRSRESDQQVRSQFDPCGPAEYWYDEEEPAKT